MAADRREPARTRPWPAERRRRATAESVVRSSWRARVQGAGVGGCSLGRGRGGGGARAGIGNEAPRDRDGIGGPDADGAVARGGRDLGAVGAERAPFDGAAVTAAAQQL